MEDTESAVVTKGRHYVDRKTGKVSDGYHTFDELYRMRALLFLALVKMHPLDAWRARKNKDGSEWEGWFLCGLFPGAGEQITFHLPTKYWSDLSGIETHDANPYYDGHTSEDVAQRIAERFGLTF